MTNQNSGKADYSYWLMVRTWTAREAAALILGYEPRFTDYYYEFIPFGEEQTQEDTRRTAIRIEREKLERVLESAQIAGAFGKAKLNKVGKPWGTTVTNREWIKWAQKNNIDFAVELLDAVKKAEVKAEKDSEEIHPRTETSLLRIIGALLEQIKKNTGQSQAKIIENIIDQHGFKDGISKPTLENCFSKANSRLKDW